MEKVLIMSGQSIYNFLRSSIFLASIGSSWSKNMRMERYIDDRGQLDRSNTVLFPDLADILQNETSDETD